MHVVSINVGRRERLEHRSFRGETGINKHPVSGPVTIGSLGLESDAVVDKRHHGGPDQAVYVYRQEDYDWWSTSLDQPVTAGMFGDNLTLAGLPEATASIGTRLVFASVTGSVTLEITAPRIPCNTLAARMNDPGFVKQFVAAERPGFYCRVIQTGSLQEGDSFILQPFASDDANEEGDGPAVSTLDIFRARYRRLTQAELRRFLAAPIDERTRRDYQRELSGRDPAAND